MTILYQKYCFLIFFLLISTTIVCAQQEGQFTHFMLNHQTINPAYVGVNKAVVFTGIYRNQWTQFQGAPKSLLATVSVPVGEKVGLGIGLSTQKAGLMTQTRGTAAYAYKLQISERNSLHLGLQGVIKYQRLDLTGDDVFIQDIDDESLQSGVIAGDYFVNVGAGLFYNYNDQLFIGVSSPTFYPTTLGVNNTASSTATLTPHFYGFVGGHIDLTDDLILKPGVLLRYAKNTPIAADVNMSVTIQERLSTGIAYRYAGDARSESLDLLLFYDINKTIGLGFAYDIVLGELRDFATGSMEVILQCQFNNTSLENFKPRFF